MSFKAVSLLPPEREPLQLSHLGRTGLVAVYLYRVPETMSLKRLILCTRCQHHWYYMHTYSKPYMSCIHALTCTKVAFVLKAYKLRLPSGTVMTVTAAVCSTLWPEGTVLRLTLFLNWNNVSLENDFCSDCSWLTFASYPVRPPSAAVRT